ncbi:MAG: hypothetical protein AAGI44_20070 [Pseudomonadota bacterium]
MSEEDFEYDYYRVRVAFAKSTGACVAEEWFHDPEPRDDLLLHHRSEAARKFYDPETGVITWMQFCTMGMLDTTVKCQPPLDDFSNAPPMPKPPRR